MDINQLLNSPQAGKTALLIARSLPPSLGLKLTRRTADFIVSRRTLSFVQGIRLNQWGVSQQKLNSNELDFAVQETVRHIALSMYNLFHYGNDSSGMQGKVEFDSNAKTVIQRSIERKQGTIVITAHFTNMEFAMQASVRRGLRGKVLTISQPHEGMEWQFGLRDTIGLETVPASYESIKAATRMLKTGGTLLTAVDRPMPESKYIFQFFDQPARLPVHHIHLALHANVPIIVFAIIMKPDNRIHFNASELIEMRHYPNRRDRIVKNAENVLSVVEQFISMAPHQWAMFHPVWPDLQEAVP